MLYAFANLRIIHSSLILGKSSVAYGIEKQEQYDMDMYFFVRGLLLGARER